jgi:hypothetical protein
MQHTDDPCIQLPILLLLLLLGSEPYDMLQHYCKARKNPCMTRRHTGMARLDYKYQETCDLAACMNTELGKAFVAVKCCKHWPKMMDLMLRSLQYLGASNWCRHIDTSQGCWTESSCSPVHRNMPRT